MNDGDEMGDGMPPACAAAGEEHHSSCCLTLFRHRSSNFLHRFCTVPPSRGAAHRRVVRQCAHVFQGNKRPYGRAPNQCPANLLCQRRRASRNHSTIVCRSEFLHCSYAFPEFLHCPCTAQNGAILPRLNPDRMATSHNAHALSIYPRQLSAQGNVFFTSAVKMDNKYP